MDEKVIHSVDTDAVIIMLKDKPDGLFTSELGVYRTEEYKEYVSGVFAIEKDAGYDIFLKLTTERDVKDWEFDAIYDYYDELTILTEALDVSEIQDCHNPTWEVKFFVPGNSYIQDKLSSVLKLHFLELQSVYEAIIDLSEDYK
ncbi:MAG: hypothetical protein FWE29_01980 [Defluviitaleaceae bacterium]|nr:hypothetical protein [Defluviitaleaceae bacterium]